MSINPLTQTMTMRTIRPSSLIAIPLTVVGLALVHAQPAPPAHTKGLTAVDGIKVGHHTLTERPTGCTTILIDGDGAVGGVSQRGGAPGTRETDLLDPLNMVEKVNAIALSGGSAFGLDAAQGVVRYLDEHNVGYKTGAGVVPIVPAAILFDLGFGGNSKIRPTADCGYKAAAGATDAPVIEGNVGAGAGATVGKMGGVVAGSQSARRMPMKAGIGSAAIVLPNGLVVAAIVAVNAAGDIIDPDTGRVVAGSRNPDGTLADVRRLLREGAIGTRPRGAENTTIGVVATNARLTKHETNRVALMADDGLARAINPSHTLGDGDTVFALATGRWSGEANVTLIGALAAEAMADAIVRAATQATSSGGLAAAQDLGTVQMSRLPSPIDRRTFVRRSIEAYAAAAVAPAILRSSAGRPAIPDGVAAGAAGSNRAVIWSRSDRSARMIVEYDTTDRFSNVRRVAGPAALEGSDYTARVVLTDLPPGQRIFYRVLFQDLTDLRSFSEPAAGAFRTPTVTAGSRDVTLAWSADTVGQGWGINADWGGLRLYDTMRRVQPDLFVHCGDTIYADQPVLPEVTLDDGSIWRNVVTPAKSKAAETIEEFRGNYQYNLADEHMRRFNADVAQLVLWDDHEVMNNWYPTRGLSKMDQYRVKSTALLAARARQAFLEYNPVPFSADDPERIYRSARIGPDVEVFALDLRSYRGANTLNRQSTLDETSALFGHNQLAWLKAQLAASRATWKVIASDLPVGLIVPDGDLFESFANGDSGAPLGRELEIASLLRFLRDRRVRNVVWITADVHYCAAHHYHPTRARFTEFDPFWEFVAGPLHAGTFGPNSLDGTFGPEVRFTGIPKGMKPNRPPSEGLQFFGTMRLDRRTRGMTVSLHNLAGDTIFSQELAPA
jgi:alkaline phosphatase D